MHFERSLDSRTLFERNVNQTISHIIKFKKKNFPVDVAKHVHDPTSDKILYILCIFFHRGKASFGTLRWRQLFTPCPMSGRREKETQWKSKDINAAISPKYWRGIYLLLSLYLQNVAFVCKYCIFGADIVAVLLNYKRCVLS